MFFKKKEIELHVMREGLIQIQICCNLSPRQMRKRKREVEDRLPVKGIGGNFEIDLRKKGKFAPVKCSEIKGNWHYVGWC